MSALAVVAATLGCSMSGDEAACDPSLIADHVGPIRTVHRVEGASLEDRCHGDREPALEAAWALLADVTPERLLDDLDLFATYEGDGETLAYAGVIGEDNTRFFVAVAVGTGRPDPVLSDSSVAEDELAVTLVHELSHVLTQTADQLDVGVTAEDCETLWNGLGCYRTGSYLAEWIEEFWTEEALASLPADGTIDTAGGVRRCELDAGFVGPYAASHPEEDFAESFAAWALAVPVPAAVEDRFAHLERSPELVAVRSRAEATGRTGLANNFGGCG